MGPIPETVIGANIVDHRDKTLLKMLEAAEADPSFPDSIASRWSMR